MGDPLKDKGWVWLAMAGVKRMKGTRPRKLRVTTAMLRWLESSLQGKGTEAAEWAAITIGCFYLLRADEFVHSGEAWTADWILLGSDVAARKEVARARLSSDADEAVIYI